MPGTRPAAVRAAAAEGAPGPRGGPPAQQIAAARRQREREAKEARPHRPSRQRRRREPAPRRLTPAGGLSSGQPGRSRRFESSPRKAAPAGMLPAGEAKSPPSAAHRRAVACEYRIRTRPADCDAGGNERRRSGGATGGGSILARSAYTPRTPRTKLPAVSEAERERKAGPEPRAYGRAAAQRRTRMRAGFVARLCARRPGKKHKGETTNQPRRRGAAGTTLIRRRGK